MQGLTPDQLNEAERSTLVMLKNLPPVLVYLIGADYPPHQVKLFLQDEGFLDGDGERTLMASAIKQNVDSIVGKMFPKPCVTEDCENITPNWQEKFCHTCQDNR